jgi:hypothetical protein
VVLKLNLELITKCLKDKQKYYILKYTFPEEIIVFYVDKICLINLKYSKVKILWEGNYIHGFIYTKRLYWYDKKSLKLSVVSYNQKEKKNIHTNIKVRTKCIYTELTNKEFPSWFYTVIEQEEKECEFTHLINNLIKEPIININIKDHIYTYGQIETKNSIWFFTSEDSNWINGVLSYFRCCKVNKSNNKIEELFIIEKGYYYEEFKITNLNEMITKYPKKDAVALLSDIKYIRY